MKYGYIRVSTAKQSLERQRTNIIREFPDAQIYEEKFTGTKLYERKQFQKLLNTVKPGDTIVFDSVSRMSRQAEEGFKLYQDLYNNGVNLVFLKEPYINTDIYRMKTEQQTVASTEDDDLNDFLKALNKYIVSLQKKQFLEAFKQAEKEVKDLSQRTKEGMKSAGSGEKIRRSRTGKTYITPKQIEAKGKIQKLAKDFGGSFSDAETMKMLNISRGTYYKYKKDLLSEAA